MFSFHSLHSLDSHHIKGQPLTQYGGPTVNLCNNKHFKFLQKPKDINMDNFVKIFDKVTQSYNNSLESWNKGFTVCYTIFPAVKDTFVYEWEITDVLNGEGMCLPCHHPADKDPETQICATLNTLKQLMSLSK